MVTDATVEKLGEICRDNPHGLLSYRDELSGLIAKLGEEGEETHRGFYNQSWNGSGHYTFDRIGRGSTHIPHLCLSVFGGIQPARLRGLAGDAVRGGAQDDGLMQRFQLLVCPSAGWSLVDRAPNRQAEQGALDLFKKTSARGVSDYVQQFGARAHNIDQCAVFSFDDIAQAEVFRWLELLDRAVKDENLHPAERAHRTKYRKMVPAIALLIHLAEGRQNPVGLPAWETALEWEKYLLPHARRVYALANNTKFIAAAALARRIESGELPSPFTERQVYLKGWTGLSAPADAKGAVQELIDAGWLRPVPEVTGGRPTTRYHINPRLQIRRQTA
jgi:hypothetical protein